MSINSILSTAISGLNASQAGLRQTSNNIANVNTDGYARTQAPQSARNVGGQGLGVDLQQVQRITDRFLLGASLSAAAEASSWESRFSVLDQVQAQFGTFDSAGSVFTRLNQVFADIGLAAQDPASSVRKLEAVNTVQGLFDEYSRLDRQIRSARAEVQLQINQGVERINQLLTSIEDLNQDIGRGRISGDATGAENQQAALLDELGSLIDIRVDQNDLGGAVVRTQNGVLLLGQVKMTLTTSTGSGGAPGTSYGRIAATTPSGASTDMQAAISGGSLHGLLALRDQDLGELQLELSELTAGTADVLNQAHTDAIAVPLPGSLSGRNTGLLGSDALGFTGQNTIALTANNGNLVSRIDVDYDAGTVSIDGGAASSIGSTIASFAAALNTAFGANGSVSFTNGKLSMSATGTNGVGMLQDASLPSDRAGRSMAAFFGMNELVTSASPGFFETGLASTDLHGLVAGGAMEFSISTADGRNAGSVSVGVTGTTMADMISALNNTSTGLGRYVNFSMDAQGQLVSTPITGAENYDISLTSDSTERGGTAITFSSLFGIGDAANGARTAALSLRTDIAQNPNLLALAKLDIDATTIAGDFVAGAGDGRGGFAIQQAVEISRNFRGAGSLSANASSLTSFAGRFAATTGARAANAERGLNSATTLQTEADTRRANLEGVNMDEELANMTLFQQSYNAAARLIQAAKELNDTLINMV